MSTGRDLSHWQSRRNTNLLACHERLYLARVALSRRATKLARRCSLNCMSEQNDQTNWVSNTFYWLIILFVIGLLVAIAIPNRIDRRKGPGLYSNACINNMRQID